MVRILAVYSTPHDGIVVLLRILWVRQSESMPKFMTQPRNPAQWIFLSWMFSYESQKIVFGKVSEAIPSTSAVTRTIRIRYPHKTGVVVSSTHEVMCFLECVVEAPVVFLRSVRVSIPPIGRPVAVHYFNNGFAESKRGPAKLASVPPLKITNCVLNGCGVLWVFHSVPRDQIYNANTTGLGHLETNLSSRVTQHEVTCSAPPIKSRTRAALSQCGEEMHRALFEQEKFDAEIKYLREGNIKPYAPRSWLYSLAGVKVFWGPPKLGTRGP